jgi:hypothetical protein
MDTDVEDVERHQMTGRALLTRSRDHLRAAHQSLMRIYQPSMDAALYQLGVAEVDLDHAIEIIDRWTERRGS